MQKKRILFVIDAVLAVGTLISFVKKYRQAGMAKVKDAVINVEDGGYCEQQRCFSKSRKDYAYTILDVASDVTDAAADKIAAIDGVIRVRVIK